MLAFLGPDLATVVVALAVFSVCLGVVGRMAVGRRRKKAGGCPHACCGCPHADACHPQPRGE